jgi:hypothetical protein
MKQKCKRCPYISDAAAQDIQESNLSSQFFMWQSVPKYCCPRSDTKLLLCFREWMMSFHNLFRENLSSQFMLLRCTLICNAFLMSLSISPIFLATSWAVPNNRTHAKGKVQPQQRQGWYHASAPTVLCASHTYTRLENTNNSSTHETSILFLGFGVFDWCVRWIYWWHFGNCCRSHLHWSWVRTPMSNGVRCCLI